MFIDIRKQYKIDAKLLLIFTIILFFDTEGFVYREVEVRARDHS